MSRTENWVRFSVFFYVPQAKNRNILRVIDVLQCVLLFVVLYDVYLTN